MYSSLSALENWLASLFAKTPHLPAGTRETLVKIAPWLALIVGILGLFSIFSAGAMSSVLFSFAWIAGGTAQIVMMTGLIAGLIASVLDLMAFKPLSARKKRGWNFIFYGVVLTVAASLLNMLFGYGYLSNLLGPLIGLWLLFEVRSMYHA